MNKVLMISHLVLTFCTLYSLSSYCQQTTNYVGNVESPARNNTSNIEQLYDNGYQGVKGNPFYPENWTQGTVLFSNGQSKDVQQLKYDVFKNQLWYINNENHLSSFDPKLIAEFSVFDSTENRQVRFKHLKRDIKVLKGDDLESGYYIFLYEGDVALIQHKTHVIVKADHYQPYGTGQNYDKLKQVDRYYVRSLFGNYYPFSRSKQSVLSFMKNHKAQVKDYIKNNDISLKNEDDLVKVFTYYNSLL